MSLPLLQLSCSVFVGLTDHPELRHSEGGAPRDWQLYGPFHSEEAARRWERMMMSLPGYAGVTRDPGWRYGFTYSAHSDTGRPPRKC